MLFFHHRGSSAHLTCSDKVAVQGVGVQAVAHRLGRSHQGLANYLTSKQTLSAGHPVVGPPVGTEDTLLKGNQANTYKR